MQQGGGSQYGVPPTEMSPPPYGVSGTQTQILGIPSTQDQLQQNQHQQQQAPEAAPPISSRPPAATGTSNLEELATAMGVCGFPDDVEAMAAGEEAERGISGNRWPRQETLALLKIRSDMDAVFRDATLKGPLWEDVSRKLAEQGYTRSAKKCKEKFENVHKYYKRTKEKSGGRQDGKSYRFYSQLEALNSSTSSPATAAAVALPSPTTMNFGSDIMGSLQPTPLTTLAPTTTTAQPSAAANPVLPQPGGATLFSFSSNTWSSGSSSDSDGEDTEEGLMGEEQGQRKRKRGNQSSSGRKMRAFLKELMQQVLERQEVMQKRFFETIEKREQERMIREEAWKRQEMARLNREHELMAQERAMSASRDASIIAFLQKITGQSIQLPQMPISVVSTPQPVVTINPPQSQQQTTTVISPPPPPPQQLKQHRATPSQHGKLQQQVYDTPGRPPPPPVPSELIVSPREQSQELGSAMGTSPDPASSRWPKMEVHALIKVRSEMEPRYQENGPKGPLWEEISAAMQRMGYNRSSKRCKEKWENINKYFKKVKESSKKRPEDSKTCPYFHQLDALYRKKIIGSSSSGGGGNEQSSQQENDLAVNAQILPITTLPPASQQPQVGNVGGGSNGGGGSGGNSEEFDQMKTSNGDRPQSLSEEGGTGIKKPEDILKELMGRGYDDMEENDSDSMTIDDDDVDEDEEQQKMAYKIEFQRSDMGNSTATTNNPGTASVTTTTTAGSFLAMVK